MIEFWGNWDAVSALATIFAAIGAVAAASIAAWSAYQATIATRIAKTSAEKMAEQHQLNTDLRKREKTFSYSLTNRNEILKSTDSIKILETIGFKTLKSNLKKAPNSEPTKKVNFNSNHRLLANHYGVLAMEYYEDTIDRQLIKNLSWFQFMRFGFIFRANLKNNPHYTNLNKLYEEWKSNPPD